MMMRKLFLISVLLLGFAAMGKSQMPVLPKDTVRMVLDNDKLQVTEYVSTPGKDVCGVGMHTHEPHLTVMLTDASILVTTPDGKSQNYDLKAGTALWFGADTHTAINNGDQEAKLLLVHLK
jgi:quercetin dioxygenase-like cupin family protein